MSITLRHQPPGSGRIAPRKPVPRGASRPVAREPLSARLPRVDLGWLKRMAWPFLLLGLGVGTFQLAEQLLPYADRPIARIAVQGELAYVSQQSIQQRIEPYAGETFFRVDLDGIRRELESMPWIAHAQVRRVWPDQIQIKLEEQLPIARWGDEALLNNQGRAFAPNEVADYPHLPQLSGPRRAQRQVMQQYQVLSQMLRPMGFSIARLELRERGSWFLSTAPDANGQSIDLLIGRDQVMEKMRRFATVYDKALKEQISNITRIDLRYAHGLAVAWRDPAAVGTADAVQQN
jgi:cell division protein FtsQ